MNGNKVGFWTELVKQQGRPIYLKVCSNFDDVGQKNQVKSLEEHGWECFTVSSHIKNSVDNQLMADLIRDITENLSKSVILISDDGDFTSIVEVLKAYKEKKVMVIETKGNIKQQLQQISNNNSNKELLKFIFWTNC